MSGNLRDLLARVEAATGADRELEGAIWYAVGGRVEMPEYGYPGFSGSTDAAQALIAAVLPKANCHGYDMTPSGVDAYVSRNCVKDGHWLFEGHGKTPARALLAALLRALSDLERLP